MTKALIVVDVQNDFADPNGSLYVKDGEKTVPVINNLTEKALENNDVIVFTGDWHPKKSKHFKTFGGNWPTHCLANTYGARFHGDLLIPRGSVVVHKGTAKNNDGYSGFDQKVIFLTVIASVVDDFIVMSTSNQDNLHGLLQIARIREVLVAGLATDYCVKQTALEAVKLGYKTKVVIDACRAVNINPDSEYRAIEEMKAAGVEIITSKDVLAGGA